MLKETVVHPDVREYIEMARDLSLEKTNFQPTAQVAHVIEKYNRTVRVLNSREPRRISKFF